MSGEHVSGEHVSGEHESGEHVSGEQSQHEDFGDFFAELSPGYIVTFSFSWGHPHEAGSRQLAERATYAGFVTYLEGRDVRLPHQGWRGGGSRVLVSATVEGFRAARAEARELCLSSGATPASFGVGVMARPPT